MNYLHTVTLLVAEEAHPGEPILYEDVLLYRQYAVLVLAKGEQTTNEDVHNAWVAWKLGQLAGTDHPCMVPFWDLAPEKQVLDAPYRDAIRRVARKLAEADPLDLGAAVAAQKIAAEREVLP